MDRPLFDIYDSILIDGLKSALGCTEPIAIAFAAATARAALGRMPERLSVECSGNIVKNVKGVTVPNSGGMKGIEVAAILGAVGGDETKALEVLSSIKDEDIATTRELLKAGICSVTLAEGVPGLYISIKAEAGDESAEATIIDCHNEICSLKKNGKIISSRSGGQGGSDEDERKGYLTVESILDYGRNADLKAVEAVLRNQWKTNERIAEAGLKEEYGATIGRTLLKRYDSKDVRIRARAKAAAGSDARMSGCSLPVVINSGSGNQGLTVSLPVIEYGLALSKNDEEILRALAVSNLIAIHQKKYIGPLSAYCGAVSAAAGAAAGIAFISGMDDKVIADSITNTLASVGGIVCDGAKPSCAAKISSALEAAILGFELAEEKKAFENGEGLVKENVEKTIETFGKVGKEGMKETDIEILHLMIE